jgi:hypothetical protein
MTELFTVHKYRVQWIFQTPITGNIIAEGETGDAHYVIEYNNPDYQAGGVHPGNITAQGVIKADRVPALAVGRTKPRYVEDDTLPDMEFSGYWMVIIYDEDHSKGHVRLTPRAHLDYSAAFDIRTATPDIVEASRAAALESVPEADRGNMRVPRLVVAPTKYIQMEMKND